jgi:hypothetical protein
MKFFILSTFISLFSWVSYAKIHDASFDFATRYDNIDYGNQESRLQERLRLFANGDISEYWQLKTLVATGTSYTSLWSTYANLEDKHNTNQNLGFRQLYGEYSQGSSMVQLGIIPPSRKPSRTNIINSGWIEGASYIYRKEKYWMATTIGSIEDINEPNILTRDRIVNYGKIRGDYQPTDSVILTTGFIVFENFRYLQPEVKYFPSKRYKDSLDFTIEFLQNEKNGVVNYSLEGNVFPLGLWNTDLREYLSLQLSYCYIDEKIGALGTLSEDFYTFGHTRILHASGKFTQKSHFSWLLEYRDNVKPRHNIGLMYKVDLN